MSSGKALLCLVLVSVFAMTASGVYVTADAPVSKLLTSGESIELGSAGPGQTVVLVMERVSDGGTCPNNLCSDGWDTVVPVEVPSDWEVEASPTHENPMKMKIKIAPDAANGRYNLTLAAVDEGNYNGLGNVTFYAIVTVTRDIFDISVRPTRVDTGVGQPAVYYVTITNTGVASDPFEIKVKDGDIPVWTFRKQVLVNYGTSRVVPYEVVLDEENERAFDLQVSSLSSPLIRRDVSLVINSRSNIISDWKATTHGLMMFPILEEPLYALMGLIGNLF